MHCIACDALLSDFESTRRIKNTRNYVDLCNHCFREVKDVLPVIERKDLAISGDFDDHLCTEGPEDVLYNNFKVHKSIKEH